MDPKNVAKWLAGHRCFFLFATLVALLVLVPVFDESEAGKLAFAGASLLVLASALVAHARTRREVAVVGVFALPAFAALVASHALASETWLVWSWAFSAAVLIVTLVRLFQYVLRPAVEPENAVDRVFGGVDAYLVIGLLWAYLGAILEYFKPGSFLGIGGTRSLHVADLIVTSFDSITAVGASGIVPHGKGARALFMLETLLGTLYLAGFVARLVSMYTGKKV
jgi:hypothetical protein